MVCCAAFDRDDEYFATAGVAKRIRIYELSSLVASGSNPVLGACQVGPVAGRTGLVSKQGGCALSQSSSSWGLQVVVHFHCEYCCQLLSIKVCA